METCDVLVVGGGPGGSTCAARLRAGGLDVVVLDKKVFPRDKTCAGWITPEVATTLGIDAVEYGHHRVMQPITRFCTGMIGGPEVLTDYARVVSYGIRRCEFDHFLLERAGVRLRLGESLESIRRADDRWIVNEALSAGFIVGAGGHFCPVARHLGNRDVRPVATVAAQEVEFEASAEDLRHVAVEGECPELYFCPDLQGYGWCFRKGNFLNIGLGRLDGNRISSHVSEFCDFLKARKKVGCAIPTRFHGHAYQLYERSAPKLVGEGMLLIGDAAGLAYPQSGEGIRPAVESAIFAADILLAANGRPAREDLEAYPERIVARFGKPRKGSGLDWLPAGALRFLAARLMSTHWFSRRVVLDQWFLHRGTPALEATGASGAPTAVH